MLNRGMERVHLESPCDVETGDTSALVEHRTSGVDSAESSSSIELRAFSTPKYKRSELLQDQNTGETR